ncbi:hypothetical protein V6N11_035573 [Hibiscus sabdariffa]|uniref:Uncharacterized protein n=1 Tax=Hibiscus sabdariffa TaxID=183260 RepID=A0ABR2R0S5_9ROSI
MRPVLKGSDPWKRVWRCQEGRKNQTEGKAPEEQENETSSSEEVNSIELKADIAEMLPRVRDLVVPTELTTAVMALVKHKDLN